MKFTKKIKLMMVAAAAVLSLSACSGGSTATGLGLSVGGSWNGKLLRSNGQEFTSFSMSIAQEANDAEDPFSGSKITGTFNSGSTCTKGGSIDGTITGDTIDFKVEDLSMTGTTGNTNMSGSWFITNADCTEGGSWHASRP